MLGQYGAAAPPDFRDRFPNRANKNSVFTIVVINVYKRFFSIKNAFFNVFLFFQRFFIFKNVELSV